MAETSILEYGIMHALLRFFGLRKPDNSFKPGNDLN